MKRQSHEVDGSRDSVRWYNEEHRHSALNWVTPMARHTGEESKLLRRREETYRSARAPHPERWSRDIRRQPIRLSCNSPRSVGRGFRLVRTGTLDDP